MLHVLNIVVKYYHRSTIKRHTMAIYSHHRTIISPEFWSMALLRYGGHPYNTVFRMAVTVYGMVESPICAGLKTDAFMSTRAHVVEVGDWVNNALGESLDTPCQREQWNHFHTGKELAGEATSGEPAGNTRRWSSLNRTAFNKYVKEAKSMPIPGCPTTTTPFCVIS